MSRIPDLLEQIRAEYLQELSDLYLVTCVLTYLPGYVEQTDGAAESFDDEVARQAFKQKQREALRLAKKYASEDDLKGISIDDVVARLSKGLGEKRRES